MEYTKKIEKCGCRINQAYNEKPFISYCPLHETAPDLYEALEAIIQEGTRCLEVCQQDTSVRTIYNIDLIDRIARLALAKARVE